MISIVGRQHCNLIRIQNITLHSSWGRFCSCSLHCINWWWTLTPIKTHHKKITYNTYFILWSSGKGKGKGLAKEGRYKVYKGHWKVLNLLPYIKIHPPTATAIHPQVSISSWISQWGPRWGEVGGGKKRSVQSLQVNIGHLMVTVGHLRVTIGHLRVTIGYIRFNLQVTSW